MMAEDVDGLVRVRFALDPSDWHGCASEGLWAELVPGSDDPNLYRLRNSPFFARGVSFRDVIRATVHLDTDLPGALWFDEVVAPGGHSTYHVLVPPSSAQFAPIWERLSALGCTFESSTMETWLGTRTLYSVDVPASTDIQKAYAILEEGELAEIWRFQEGHCGHVAESGRH